MSDVSSVQTAITDDVTPVTEPAPTGEAQAAPVAAGGLNPEGYQAIRAETSATEGEAPEGTFVEIRDEKFQVVENLPGIVLLDLGVASDPSATQGEQLRALREFLKAAIVQNEQPRFERYLRTATPTIDIAGLNKIVEDLLAVIGGRPTE